MRAKNEAIVNTVKAIAALMLQSYSTIIRSSNKGSCVLFYSHRRGHVLCLKIILSFSKNNDTLAGYPLRGNHQCV